MTGDSWQLLYTATQKSAHMSSSDLTNQMFGKGN